MPEPLLYRGSVKDVYGREGGSKYTFVFSDRYSIFDWGEMPDALAQKGEALAVMGDLFFRFLGDAKNWSSWTPKFSGFENSAQLAALRKSGLAHHSFGLVSAAENPLAPGARSNRLSVQALPRLQPKVSHGANNTVHWDYSAYAARPAPMLVPLEVVFRFGAPSGSSYLQRAKVSPDTWFERPVVEFFTKLEPTDRFLPRPEAQALAGMSDGELQALEELTLLVAMRLRDLFAKLGLELWDGKFEFTFLPGAGERGFALVDSIGPDELRLVRDGTHFSKEVLRRFYRPSSWYKAVEKAKELAASRGSLEWKKICREELGAEPEKLPTHIGQSVASLYTSLTEALAQECFGTSIYNQAPSIATLTRTLHEELQ